MKWVETKGSEVDVETRRIKTKSYSHRQKCGEAAASGRIDALQVITTKERHPGG